MANGPGAQRLPTVMGDLQAASTAYLPVSPGSPKVGRHPPCKPSTHRLHCVSVAAGAEAAAPYLTLIVRESPAYLPTYLGTYLLG